MSYLGKTINFIIKRTPLLCGLLFAAVLALLPISARAQCAQWDAGGDWEIQQSNGYTLYLHLTQSGKTITGRSTYGTTTGGTKFLGVLLAGGDPSIHTDDVSGNIEGNDFYVLIGTAGVYRGNIGASGRIDGTTYDKNKPSSTATWFSSRAMKCAPPPVQSPPRPPRSSGKMPKTEPASPPARKPPWIAASQAVFPVPSVPTGFVILTWDAGPDHPNAKVWLGKQIVAQGGKGGLQMPVARGQRYEFMLVDADKAFAVVNFIAIGP